MPVGDQPVPFAGTNQLLALGKAARHRQNQSHHHVGGIVGQHAWCIGHGYLGGARRAQGRYDRRRHRNWPSASAVHPVQAASNTAASIRSVTVGTSTSQRAAAAASSAAVIGGIAEVQFDIEQFGHAGFDRMRQPPRDDDLGAGTGGSHSERVARGDGVRQGRAVRRLVFILALLAAAPALAIAPAPEKCPEGKSGQPVPRFVSLKSGQGASARRARRPALPDHLGLYSQGPAGRDHRRILHLAADSRSRWHHRLGQQAAAAKRPHGRRDRQYPLALCRPRPAVAHRLANRARHGRPDHPVRRRSGAGCRTTAARDTSCAPRSGAPIRTRRSAARHARARRP